MRSAGLAAKCGTHQEGTRILIKVEVFKLVVQVFAFINSSKGKKMSWQEGPLAVVLRAMLRRVIPALLAALLGTLADAGLLDGELGRALVELLGS